jgi:hypothetical protein
VQLLAAFVHQSCKCVVAAWCVAALWVRHLQAGQAPAGRSGSRGAGLCIIYNLLYW